MDIHDETFTFETTLWLWQPKARQADESKAASDNISDDDSGNTPDKPAKGSWYFASLPLQIAEWINFLAPHAGWGSVPVTITVGRSTWQTSIFRDKKNNTYILPVKAAIRNAEALSPGAPFTLSLQVR